MGGWGEGRGRRGSSQGNGRKICVVDDLAQEAEKCFCPRPLALEQLRKENTAKGIRYDESRKDNTGQRL